MPLALVLVMSLSLLPTSAFAVTQWTAKEVMTEVPVDRYTRYSYFKEGRMAVLGQNGKWGFLDETGREIVPCIYEYANDFYEGLAHVEGKKYTHGFIDKSGKEVIPVKYAVAGNFVNGLAHVGINDPTAPGIKLIGLMDTTGKFFVEPKYDRGIGGFSDGLATVHTHIDTDYIDMTGKEVDIEERYEGRLISFGNFSEGLATVGDVFEKCGYIDTSGELVIPCTYDGCRSFVEGRAVVHQKYKYGVIDKSGVEITPLIYDRIGNFSGGMAVVSIDNPGHYNGSTSGAINAEGELVIPVQYEGLSTFYDGVARLGVQTEKGMIWGYIDTTGREIVSSTEYDRVEDFSENLGVVTRKGEDGKNRVGCVNAAGELVVPMEYESLSPFLNGLSVAKKGGKYGVIDKNERVIVPFEYDKITRMQAARNSNYSREYYYDWARENFMKDSVMSAQRDGKVCYLFFEANEIVNMAYVSPQSVLIDGSPVEFQCYALKDENGNPTNYVKLRDVASVLNGTSAQFNVGWDGAVNIETGKDYTPNGTEMSTPFSGDRSYDIATAPTNVNGETAALDAIVLKDDKGGAYTYYKLRDLGTALGFTVDWSAEKGVFIETE